MRRELEARLADAVGTGEIVRIVYHAGSQPGAARDIRPVAIAGGVLRAYDIAAGTEKHFRLSKIEMTDESAVPPYDPSRASPREEQSTISEFFTPRIATLEALGLRVVLTRDALSLHRHFKNGKPRKTPEIEIVRDDPAEDTAATITEEVVVLTISLAGNTIALETRKSAPTQPGRWRAYGVRSEGLPAARRFSDLWRAAALVLEQARVRAPNPNDASLEEKHLT